MTGIILVAHGGLARALADAVTMILGRPSLLKAVDLGADECLDDLARGIEDAWRELEAEKAARIIILTDMFGSSCSNVAGRVVHDKGRVPAALVTGVNLPMVIEAAIDRDLYSLEELVAKVIAAGNKSIVDIAAALDKRLGDY